MKLLALVALLATFSAGTPVPEAAPPVVHRFCMKVSHGWCPDGDNVKYVEALGGCYDTRKAACPGDSRRVYGAWRTGCHTVTRNSGRCDGPYDYVLVNALDECRWTQRGRCPGGENTVYVT